MIVVGLSVHKNVNITVQQFAMKIENIEVGTNLMARKWPEIIAAVA